MRKTLFFEKDRKNANAKNTFFLKITKKTPNVETPNFSNHQQKRQNKNAQKNAITTIAPPHMVQIHGVSKGEKQKGFTP